LLVEKKPMPDLIFVDGGINQINACKSSLEKLNINIPVCGLKKDDHHRTKTLIDGTLMKEIDLTSEIDIFNYLTRIQDEVHRFTINYHKQIRSKGALGSILGNVDGIGEKRRKELLKKYGSLEKIKEASTEELTSIIPVKVAEELKKYLEEMNAK